MKTVAAKIKEPTRKELLGIVARETEAARYRLYLCEQLEQRINLAQTKITNLENALKLRNYQVEQIAAALQLKLETSTAI